MPKITFITAAGESIIAKGTSGSVMELARKYNVAGIDGDCGGVCSCGTCHVHVAQEDFQRVGPAGEVERMMLEFDDDVNECSRLCCQVEVTDAVDGVTLRVPGN